MSIFKVRLEDLYIFRDEIAYKEQDNITYRHFHVLKILS